MSERVNAAARRAVIERAGDRCEYCKTPARFAPDALTVDHIVPASRGGSSGAENLAQACQGCNGRKYTRVTARDPVTDRLVPLFNPRRHRWKEHFAWSHDGTLVIGLTATGRATAETLELNRRGLVGLREALVAFGAHPPAD
jgi:hypothetical protein